jgi:hypothetical protein
MSKRGQAGLSLVWAVILAGVFAGIAMMALISIRQERDLMGEAVGKLTGSAPAKQAIDAARQATGGQAQQAALRKCVIDGKTVVSNTECSDDNKTSKTIEIHDSRGIEAPKKPEQAQAAEPTSNPMIDKVIEKQLK